MFQINRSMAIIMLAGVFVCISCSGGSLNPLSSNDGLDAFVSGFNQELTSRDMNTLQSIMSSSFETTLECFSEGTNSISWCTPDQFLAQIQHNSLSITTTNPLIMTCVESSISAYEIKAVMATYSYSMPAVDDQIEPTKTGYAALTFIKPIESANWEWYGFDLVTGQC